MKQLRYLLLFLSFAALVILNGCSKFNSSSANSLQNAGITGKVYYTKYTFLYEKNRFRTTNYRKGVIVPINTKVAVESIKGNTIKLILSDTGIKVDVVNIENYSGENIQGIYDKLLSPTPVNLSMYSKSTINKIKSGIVEPGMDKKTVILALGYPPKHKTPSLELSVWKYWQNRFNTFDVIFDEKGKVVSTKN